MSAGVALRGEAFSPQQAAAVDALFARTYGPQHPGAVVAVVRGGELAHLRCFGLANVEHRIAVSPETVFRLGSVSKHLCATLVLILHDRGRLDVDAPVRRYIPELPACAGTMTLRHLLTMTSGFHDGIALTIFGGSGHLALTRDRHLDIVTRYERLAFEPGTQVLYSNTNYLLLSLVIERVTGDPLAAVFAREIFGPLGMTSSRLAVRPVEAVQHRACGYVPGVEAGTFDTGLMLYEMSGDGGVDVSMPDFVRWFQAYRASTLVGRGYRERMETDVLLPNGERSRYALGLDVSRHTGATKVSHAGGMPGYLAEFNFWPEADLGILLLSNWMDPGLFELSDRIFALSNAGPPQFGEPPMPARPVSEPCQDADRALAGFYLCAEHGMALELQMDEAGVVCHLLGERSLLSRSPDGGYAALKRGVWYRILPVRQGGELFVDLGSGDPVRFVRSVPSPIDRSPEDLSGVYHSALLGETHVVTVGDDGRPRVALGSTLRQLSWRELVRWAPDVYTAHVAREPTATNLVARFTRDAAGRVDALSYSTFQCRNIRFERVRKG